ncbi:DUF5994 family protein [Mycobacterium sp.]|uniref:DUF5994 family protein n=1 Tax=Mycobacterium sp. TaxID=1785 RepID=UPI003C744B8E
MSAPTFQLDVPQVRQTAVGGLRLRLKPTHRSRAFVQGAWWPRSDQLTTELPPLLAALSLRLGRINRVVYDENSWAPTSLRTTFGSGDVILDGSPGESINTLSVIGEQFDTLVLLVVPPYTDAGRAYTIVMRAASPNDVSTADELLGIGPQEAADRQQALIAHQRWESEGGALRQAAPERDKSAAPAQSREVHCAQRP